MRRLTPTRPGSGGPIEASLRAFAERNLAGVAVARSCMFAVIATWVFANNGVAVGLRNLPIFVAFAGMGLGAYLLVRGRPGRLPLLGLFVVLDVALVAWTLLYPGRTYPAGWPWPMVLRQPDFLYALIFPALALLTFRPRLVLWAGGCVTAAWLAATWLIASRPGTLSAWSYPGLGPDQAAALARYLDPRYVHLDDALARGFAGLLLTALMALAAWQARRLVFEQAEAARGRANLARYVAPTMVERLAGADAPDMGRARRLDGVAVLFADVRGFTALAEGLSPEATMDLLRGFHGRMAEAVFRHGGTLDKFIGDGLMATFGTPEPAPGDAARALACARDMLATVTGWNAERLAAGRPALAVGIGLHRGPVTTGDIGGASRFEFAVIGDTVNVASRLERLTRELGTPLVASEDLVRQAEEEGAAVGDLRSLGSRPLRGRRGTIAVRGMPEAGAASSAAE